MKGETIRTLPAEARRALSCALLAVGAVGLQGCYQFIPVEPTAVPTGARVRAELSASGAERLETAATRSGGSRVEGRLVDASPDGSLLLEISRPSGEAPVGVTARPLFSRVTVGPSDLLALELKKLHWGRTTLLVGGGALAAGVLVSIAYDTYGRGSEGGGPPVDEALIPIFSIRW